MTVEQFDPQATKKSSNSAENQTTTLDIPSKMIEEQHQAVVTSHLEAESAAKVGFVSVGCLR
jgi:ribosomal protein S12 methylthiotransferase